MTRMVDLLKLKWLSTKSDRLTKWERKFITSLLETKPELSQRQEMILCSLYRKIRFNDHQFFVRPEIGDYAEIHDFDRD